MDFQGCLSLLGVIGGLVSAVCAVISVFQARKSKEEREGAEKAGRSLEVLADAVANSSKHHRGSCAGPAAIFTCW